MQTQFVPKQIKLWWIAIWKRKFVIPTPDIDEVDVTKLFVGILDKKQMKDHWQNCHGPKFRSTKKTSLLNMPGLLKTDEIQCPSFTSLLPTDILPCDRGKVAQVFPTSVQHNISNLGFKY